MKLKDIPLVPVIGGTAIVLLLAAMFVPAWIEEVKHPTAKVQMTRTTEGTVDSGRFNVTLSAKFYDPLAYDNTRGIYLITDKKTGKEFVGVSGVGISELGSHTDTYTDGSGKSHTTIVNDER